MDNRITRTPVWLAVRLLGLAVRLSCFRPKVGGLGWLAVRACGPAGAVNLFLRWLFTPVGLLMQLTWFLR